MSRSALDYLHHILDETQYLLNNVTGISKEQFVLDETLQRASVLSLELIGEAVKQIPEPLRRQYSFIEWRAIAAMRDRLVNTYFSVDYDLVWDIFANKVPQLHQAVEQIIQKERNQMA